MRFSVYRPEGEVRGGLLWLSGLTCNEENFITKAGAFGALAHHQLMVFCPDTSPRGLNLPGEHENFDFGSGAGFYVDASTDGYKDHYRMESYIAEEFLEIIHEEFLDEKSVSVFGHSMGGHGALTIGLRHPDKFKSISAFSPIVNPIDCPWGQKAFLGYLGAEESQWKTYDACELIKSGKTSPTPILIDQGTHDEFLEIQLKTDAFKKVCESVNQPCSINYRDGYDHSYYFISTFIDTHIEHHAQFL